MPAEARKDNSVRRAATIVVGRLRTLRSEAGFTLIEMVLATLMLAIMSAPVGAILASGAAISSLAGERTGADQIAQAQIESLRAIPYTQVGLTNGNPSGILAASTSTTLPSGEAITITRAITWVADPIPTAFVTNADYKKVVLTIKRNSDNRQLTQKTTYVSSASAPPFAGSTWTQVKRQTVDAVTAAVLPGVSVNLTGGPKSENRTDTTDGSGTVIFPALTSSSTSTPVFTLVSTLSGYNVYPDDLSPGAASSIGSTPGLNSTGLIRMYRGTSLTVNVQNSASAAWTTGATVTLDSSRCGTQSISVPAGQSSVTITTCDTWNGKTVSLPPNVLGQVPLFDKYFVSGTGVSGGNTYWGATTSSGVSVPTSYPGTLTQSVIVKLSTQINTTKQITVTVKKGGSNDTAARVELTGGPASIYLYGVTNGSGQVTFTVPVPTSPTTTTYTANANDMGVQKGSATTSSMTSTTTSPVALTVNIS
jgi:hypothetical protein